MEQGIANDPTRINPGMRYGLLNRFQAQAKSAKTADDRMRNRTNAQGLGHPPASIAPSGGVVVRVPTLKYSSCSSSVRLLKTSENISPALHPWSLSTPATAATWARTFPKIPVCG